MGKDKWHGNFFNKCNGKVWSLILIYVGLECMSTSTMEGRLCITRDCST
jgi:hypothetical protein